MGDIWLGRFPLADSTWAPDHTVQWGKITEENTCIALIDREPARKSTMINYLEMPKMYGVVIIDNENSFALSKSKTVALSS